MLYNTLYAKAIEIAQNSYSPYSHFKVGVAVLLDDDTIITGTNQENSSYGLCMCAERVAINYTLSQHPQATIKAVAISSPSTKEPVYPCGACLQVMQEVVIRQKTDFHIIMTDYNAEYIVKKVSELLPHPFNVTTLKSSHNTPQY